MRIDWTCYVCGADLPNFDSPCLVCAARNKAHVGRLPRPLPREEDWDWEVTARDDRWHGPPEDEAEE
jgi:predicted amidophosphoribosyltransferase